MRVPVRHWRTLFHYLRRLDDTFHEAQADGRSWVNWHLREDGVIWVSAWELIEAEQQRRGALPEGFDPAPWTRAALALEPSYAVLAACPRIELPGHPCCTLPAPMGLAPSAPLQPP